MKNKTTFFLLLMVSEKSFISKKKKDYKENLTKNILSGSEIRDPEKIHPGSRG
jgi:hypothetical protein